jgi:hypothetical protein
MALRRLAQVALVALACLAVVAYSRTRQPGSVPMVPIYDPEHPDRNPGARGNLLWTDIAQPAAQAAAPDARALQPPCQLDNVAPRRPRIRAPGEAACNRPDVVGFSTVRRVAAAGGEEVVVACPVPWRWTEQDHAITDLEQAKRAAHRPGATTHLQTEKDGKGWARAFGPYWREEPAAAEAAARVLPFAGEFLEVVCGQATELFYRVVERPRLAARQGGQRGLSLHVLVVDSVSRWDFEEALPGVHAAAAEAPMHTTFEFAGATRRGPHCHSASPDSDSYRDSLGMPVGDSRE